MKVTYNRMFISWITFKISERGSGLGIWSQDQSEKWRLWSWDNTFHSHKHPWVYPESYQVRLTSIYNVSDLLVLLVGFSYNLAYASHCIGCTTNMFINLSASLELNANIF